MDPLVNIAIDAARQAGDIIIHASKRLDTVTVNTKQQHDYVTEVDQQSEKLIIETIRKAYPHHAILGEESGHQPSEGNITWIIDPLDGTSNFVHGFPHYAVSIGIKEKNHLRAGVIYDPVRQDLFTATKGNGAMLNRQRLRIDPNKQIKTALLGTGFPFRNKEKLHAYIELFETIFSQCDGVRRAGSAALDLAYVAASRLDGFWEIGLHPWDIAAGALMIKEAGGLISDFSGGENYLANGQIIAGPSKVYKAMLKVIHTYAKRLNAGNK